MLTKTYTRSRAAIAGLAVAAGLVGGLVNSPVMSTPEAAARIKLCTDTNLERLAEVNRRIKELEEKKKLTRAEARELARLKGERTALQLFC